MWMFLIGHSKRYAFLITWHITKNNFSTSPYTISKEETKQDWTHMGTITWYQIKVDSVRHTIGVFAVFADA